MKVACSNAAVVARISKPQGMLCSKGNPIMFFSVDRVDLLRLDDCA
jgi:hypothetical protein